MQIRHYRDILLLITLLTLAAVACGFSSNEESGPPRNATVVDVAANTSLRPWLEGVVNTFNESELETSDGKPVYVTLQSVEAGEAATALAAGEIAPAVWIPDDPVWTNVLADQGNPNYQGDCASLGSSPLVLAMWRPLAESLGWPGLPLGWLDVGSLAADPSTWKFFSGGRFGDSLRLGHTHPGLSGSGAATLLAIVQAAEAKPEAVTVQDIQQPIVQASVGAFEGAVSWFSHSTDSLGQTMNERGSDFLGAAVLYESTVVYYGGGQIVPVYPLEGTFVATHPACVNEGTDLETITAARFFRDYLMDEPAQAAALAAGLRPINSNVPLGAPLDDAHGVDWSQPEVVFNPPTVAAVYAAQELWQAARKPVNLVMLLDTSGSMAGDKMENARASAVQFVEQMGDADYLTLVAFSTFPDVIINHQQIGPARDKIVRAIEGLVTDGDTSLYDAIGDGATLIAETTSPRTTNALVVLSDGLDTASYRYGFDETLMQAAAGHDTTVFTIAYGSDADENLLAELANRANGNFYRGDEASIAAIYEEMSAAFGGSLGIGR